MWRRASARRVPAEAGTHIEVSFLAMHVSNAAMGEETMRKLIPIALVLALFACKKAEGPVVSSTQVAEVSRLDSSKQQGFVLNAVAQTQADGAPLQRMIIRSASISMVVDDTGATIDRITAASEAVGGYIS